MIDVALACDDEYAPHAAAMLHSLVAANPASDIRAHVLHSPDLSAAVIDRLRGMVAALGAAIDFHEIAEREARGLPAMGRIAAMTWYRLMLPDLLPSTQRVLYLDCDLLVVDSITPLWELDLDGFSVAAVTNVFPDDLSHRPGELGMGERDYFNAGVLLLNLDDWRANGWSERIVSLARSQRLAFGDQDALNIVLRTSRLALHPRWNCQNSILYFHRANDLLGPAAAAEARAHPAIVHFEGPAFAKPWHYLSTHPYRAMYFEHRAHTPWPEVPLEGKTMANRIVRRLPAATVHVARRARGYAAERVAGIRR